MDLDTNMYIDLEYVYGYRYGNENTYANVNVNCSVLKIYDDVYTLQFITHNRKKNANCAITNTMFQTTYFKPHGYTKMHTYQQYSRC